MPIPSTKNIVTIAKRFRPFFVQHQWTWTDGRGKDGVPTSQQIAAKLRNLCQTLSLSKAASVESGRLRVQRNGPHGYLITLIAAHGVVDFIPAEEP